MRIPIPESMAGRPLSDLPPEDKVGVWFVRAWNSGAIPEDDYGFFGGAVFMLHGLNHHYRAYISHRNLLADYRAHLKEFVRKGPAAFMMSRDEIRSLKPEERIEAWACAHEATAYLNRLGQFYYFAKNPRVDATDAFHRVAELMPIRMKYSAHRSIDVPRGEPESVLRDQALSFADIVFSPDDLEFQLRTEEGVIYFRPQDDHDAIFSECYSVLERFYRE